MTLDEVQSTLSAKEFSNFKDSKVENNEEALDVSKRKRWE